jgi:hypothetical protein
MDECILYGWMDGSSSHHGDLYINDTMWMNEGMDEWMDGWMVVAGTVAPPA